MAYTEFGGGNQTALADFMIEKFNLVGRDAAYSRDRKTLSWLPRDMDSLRAGKTHETIKIAPAFSGSTDWVEGNKRYSPTKSARWDIEFPFAQYGRLSFDALELARTPMGRLIDTKAQEADGVAEAMLNSLEFEIWGDQTLALGRVTVSGTTTVTATLATPSDVYNFQHGQHVTSNTAADGSGTAHTNVYRVDELDPQAGTVTLIRVEDNSSAIANNDYVHVVGTAGSGMPGIPKFIPASAPSDTLLGVTRNGSPAISGWRFPFRGTISETIQWTFSGMGRWVRRSKARFNVCLSTTDWLRLSLEQEGRAAFTDPTAIAKWGVEGLTVRTSWGPITCVAVPQLADGRGYVIDWSSWKLMTLKNLPHVIDEDGLTFERGGIDAPDGYKNGDLFAMKFRIWKHLLCVEPMSNATFPTV